MNMEADGTSKVTFLPTRYIRCDVPQQYVFSMNICLLGIMNYMLEQSKPPSTPVNSVKTMRNMLHQASDVTIIGCFSGEDDPALETFQVAGEYQRGVRSLCNIATVVVANVFCSTFASHSQVQA